MAHGLAASLHDWDDLLPVLASSGYAGYALDLLGHGESEKPADHHAYSIDRVFEHYSQWIDSLVLRRSMVLIGHSLGGALALMYAIRHPGRVRAIVLVNPFYEKSQLPPVLQLVFRRQLLNTHLIERTSYRLFRVLVDLSSINLRLDARKPHVLPERIRHQTALDYTRASAGIYNIPRTLHNLVLDLPHIRQPALLIWGNRDQTLAPSSFQKLAGVLPNLRGVHSMPVCGHVPHQCHPEKFNPIVMDFLKSLQEAGRQG